jgi:hypothetical protein
MSLRQRSEPTLVQALVAELAVEALHVVVLRWLAGLDQPQLDAAFARLLVEGSSGELGTLIGAQGLRPRSKPRNRVQDASDVLAGDAMIDDDVDRLLAESSTIVRHFSRRPCSKASLTKSIDHTWFGRSGSTSGRRSTATLLRRRPPLHLQMLLAVQPMHALDVDVLALAPAATHGCVDSQSADVARPGSPRVRAVPPAGHTGAARSAGPCVTVR